ncbi:MAG: sigma-54-dependent transcriptional regulator [Nitrospirota bacterium]
MSAAGSKAQMPWAVLIVEDEEAQRRILGDFLKGQGYRVQTAANGREGLAKFQQDLFDFVLADYKMPGMDGLDLLREVRGVNPEARVVLITAFATVESAVAAMKEGALDYLTKPVNLEELLIILQRAAQGITLMRENRALKEMLRERHQVEGVIAVSPKMEHVLSVVKRAAGSNAPVLILGESGTGKEIIARILHLQSPRGDKPLLSMNCAAIPETLLESELFGHEKGAFTGAVHAKPGRFELAHTGSLFLDEIGDMSPGLQAKLLRVLQEQTFERLGGTRTVNVDVRIITATNRDLEELMRQGRFRQDLYYRLNVVEVHLPALRDRREDIPHLVDHFLRTISGKHGTDTKTLSREAHETLLRYDWPGNVRDLENVIERACILSRGPTVTLEDLPPVVTGSRGQKESVVMDGSEPLPAVINRIERDAILQALEKTGGIQTRAATLLGISERVLRYKMGKYGLG